MCYIFLYTETAPIKFELSRLKLTLKPTSVGEIKENVISVCIINGTVVIKVKLYVFPSLLSQISSLPSEEALLPHSWLKSWFGLSCLEFTYFSLGTLAASLTLMTCMFVHW